MDGGILLNRINEQLADSIVPSSSVLDPLKDFPLFANQFAYAIDHSSLKVISHRGFDSFLGYINQIITVNFILDLFHPDDASRAMELTSHVLQWAGLYPTEPFSSVFSLNYRIRKANEEYIKILRQTTSFEIDKKKGTLLKSISICTDITHLEVSNTVSAKFIGGHSEVSLEGINNTNPIAGNIKLSQREMDILALAARGKTSEAIGDILNISMNTVNTHRRNMLKRTGFGNIAQLIAYMVGKRMI
jgi:DNA-binding CsgD family transcriptional regulator